MSLSIGIVGLPNVGKSTLFNALTKKSVPAENYPFCTIDPSVGIVPVPDFRLDNLSKLSASEKTIPAVVEFTDIAGLVKGASVGEGLGNKFLANIREVDAILEVVRIFEDENITHVHGRVNPLDDIKIINLELIMADIQTVNKRLEGLGRDVKRGDKKAILEKEVLDKVLKILEVEKLLSQSDFEKEEKEILKGLHLLTAKPILYALNKKASDTDVTNSQNYKDLIEYFNQTGSNFVIIDAGSEFELKDLDSNEKQAFKAEMELDSDGLEELINKSYETLGLMTYFTTGEKETRAWTTKIDSTAPEAGMAIHTDFKEKFIRAEVVSYEHLIESGSYAKAREKGQVRTEGKEYVVKDGDVIEFRV